jgi:hypothetical protein
MARRGLDRSAELKAAMLVALLALLAAAAPHGFDHDSDPRTREVLVAFLAFLGTHLSPGPAPG